MDLKISTDEDFQCGYLFEINESNYAITKREWVVELCEYPNLIQLILDFEIINFLNIDSGYEDPEFPVSIWGHALVHPKHYCNKYLQDICDEDFDEIMRNGGYKLTWALSDALSYNCGINFYPDDELYHLVETSEISSVIKEFDEGDYRHFKTESDAYDYIHDFYIPALLKVNDVNQIVYIDNCLNKIGTTGIDYINNVVRGDELFEPAMNRWKNGHR